MCINNEAKWQRELRSFLGIKSGMLVEGNILDKYYYKENGEEDFDDFDRIIHTYGKEIGSEVVFYNPIQGFYCYESNEEAFLAPYLEGYVCKMGKILKYEYGTYIPVYENKKSMNEGKINEIQVINCCSGKDISETEEESLKQVNMSKVVLRAMVNREARYDGNTGNFVNKKDYPSKIFVINFASRLENCNLDEMARTEMFMNLYLAINNASVINGKKNMVIMVVDKYNDIPLWMYHNNPNIRTFHIECPDRKTRKKYFSVLANYNNNNLLKNMDNNTIEKFIIETNGLLCAEIDQLISLATSENIEINEIEKAIKIYKYGIKESPWEELGDNVVERLNLKLSERVKGQDTALDIGKRVIMRAVKGLSGLQHSSADSKPRGVLFFAGPTGVGKTETAKTIAETIFGDEDACIRFDMSEYREQHSDQKLFGAPPGYVGYEGGGQLTNAIKNHPFSVLLFDEIEKAHPSIMDKFLQILEDGRMTDNQGNTVYFSECIIIFTSNIGISKLLYDSMGRPIYDEFGNHKKEAVISISDPFNDDSEEFKEKTDKIIKNGVKNYFINIGRPELLNRLGENNIVVFQFIDRKVAEVICESKISNILVAINKKLDIQVDVADIVNFMKNKAIANRGNGGRGIGNMIEDKFINPLAEYICSYNGKLSRIKCYINDNNVIEFRGEA